MLFKNKKRQGWLLPTFLILFIAEILMLPIVLEYSYADRSESIEHVLTYTTGKLTWDAQTHVSANQIAELNIFQDAYTNVQSENNEKVVAPGTDGFTIVRLHNNSENAIKFKAALFEIKEERLPVLVSMEAMQATASNWKPELPGRVIQAYEGSLSAHKIQDFDLQWKWIFEESDIQDLKDTELGNEVDPEEITVGIYIVVEDNNEVISPDGVDTGVSLMVQGYFTLMIISLLVVILLLLRRKAEKRNEIS